MIKALKSILPSKRKGKVVQEGQDIPLPIIEAQNFVRSAIGLK